MSTISTFTSSNFVNEIIDMKYKVSVFYIFIITYMKITNYK